MAIETVFDLYLWTRNVCSGGCEAFFEMLSGDDKTMCTSWVYVSCWQTVLGERHETIGMFACLYV